MAQAHIVLIYHVADEKVGREVELFLVRLGNRIIKTSRGECRAFRRLPTVVEYTALEDLVELSTCLRSATTLLVVVSNNTTNLLSRLKVLYPFEMMMLFDRTIYFYEDFLPEEVLYKPCVVDLFDVTLDSSHVISHMRRHLNIVFPTAFQVVVRRVEKNYNTVKRYTINALFFLRSIINRH